MYYIVLGCLSSPRFTALFKIFSKLWAHVYANGRHCISMQDNALSQDGKKTNNWKKRRFFYTYENVNTVKKKRASAHHTVYIVWHKSLCHLPLLDTKALQSLRGLKNSFAVRLVQKSVLKLSPTIPPHLKCVATQPRDISDTFPTNTSQRLSLLRHSAHIQPPIWLSDLPSVLWHGWFGVTKSIRLIKNRVMKCWRGYPSGARCKWFAYGSSKDSVVRGKPLQLERTYHRRRTLRKTKTARKGTGNHPGKYVIRETVSMQPHHSAV